MSDVWRGDLHYRAEGWSVVYWAENDGTHAITTWEYHEAREAEIERLRARHDGYLVIAQAQGFGLDCEPEDPVEWMAASIERLRAENEHLLGASRNPRDVAEIERLQRVVDAARWCYEKGPGIHPHLANALRELEDSDGE